MPAAQLAVISAIAGGLGLLGFPSLTMGERARPTELTDVDDRHWNRFVGGRSHPMAAPIALEGYRRGLAVLHAEGGLRWRRPYRVNRTRRCGGDAAAEPIGAELVVDDHLLVRLRTYRGPSPTVRPAHLFDRLLLDPPRPRGVQRGDGDWFEAVAPREYDAFVGAVRILGGVGSGRLDPTLLPWARPLWLAVAHASADRWSAALARTSDPDGMVLRLLGVGTLPACVPAPDGRIHRVPSQWEWRQRFTVRRVNVFPVHAGAARVGFHVLVAERAHEAIPIEGQVDLRWTGGWFTGTPAARISLRTPWTSLPGVRPVA